MTTIRWAPQAADDLEAIRDFIARDSPHYAQLVCQRILESIEQLAVVPLMGRIIPELAPKAKACGVISTIAADTAHFPPAV